MSIPCPRRAMSGAAAAVCLAAALGPARAQGTTGGARTMQLSPAQKVSFLQSVALIGAAYRELARDYTAKDAEALCRWMDRYCTADFSLRPLGSRTRSRADVAASVRRVVPGLRTAEPAAVRLRQLSILGDVAVVQVAFRYADTATDASGKVAPRSGERFTRDTWVRAGQEWRLQRSEEVSGAALAPRRTAAGARPAGAGRQPSGRGGH